MHSRVGLDTPYLSDEWFDCVEACVDEAEKQDMKAWLYDEDRWPSGAAGGLVTRNPKYRMRALKVIESQSSATFKWTADTVAAFTASLDGVIARNVKRIPRGRRPGRLDADQTLVVFVVELQSCSDWYNGFTYLDTLNPEAVKAFIQVTHEAYRKTFGDRFGGVIPGMFTDEPNHGNMLSHNNSTGDAGGLPWTGVFPSVFRKRYGYDLVPHLMELVYDVDARDMTPARYHYHDCVTHLYVDAFSRQIGEWCARNNLLFTGHQLAEESLSSQVGLVGSCMRNYEYMHAPGMDLLTEHWRVFNTAKQVASVARQFGRRWRLTETYGCTGWDFPFLGHKALGDWQVALGINFRCQHLSWYTMEGEAKRDYPAGIFYQSPWWELYPKVEDYFARIHAVMTRGSEVRDLLVIHPVESMWTLVKKGWKGLPATQDYDGDFEKLTNELLAAHLDFDFGDEEILSRHASVTRNAGAPAFRVGKATYKTVLVPPLKTMRRSTLALLKRFRAAGGTVVFVGSPASYVEAMPSGDVVSLAESCQRVAEIGSELSRPLESSRRLSITDGAGKEINAALYLLREDADASYLFVCNTGEDFIHAPGNQMQQPMARDRVLAFEDVRIRGFAGFRGAPLELDPETGEIRSAKAKRHADGWEIATSFPMLGSRLFVIPRKSEATPAATRPLRTRSVVKLGGRRWDITLSEDANLVLDRPSYRIGTQRWNPEDEIMRVDRKVREALGLKVRGGAMKQPWTREPSSEPKRIAVTLSYKFDCESLPSGAVSLALEQPKTFRVRFNGTDVCADAESGWWVDRSLRKIQLDGSLFRLGENELILECDYSETHPGLEIVYIVGAFGTVANEKRVAVTALPKSLELGDWVPQGLAFYSGHVGYRRRVTLAAKSGERVFVKVPEYRGVAIRVLVDGEVAGVSGWAPNEVDITPWAEGKPVDLEIQVIGHRRNSHGPFHLTNKWPAWTGPGEYVPDAKNWFDGYQLVPCGIMKPPHIEIRK